MMHFRLFISSDLSPDGVRTNIFRRERCCVKVVPVAIFKYNVAAWPTEPLADIVPSANVI